MTLLPASVLVSLFVWRLPFDLSIKGSPASSYATAGIALRVTDVLKPLTTIRWIHQRGGQSVTTNKIILRHWCIWLVFLQKCHLKFNKVLWVPERRRYKTSVTAHSRLKDFRSKSQSWFVSVGFKVYRFALIDKQSLKRIRRARWSVTLGTAAEEWMEIRISFYLFAPYGWLSRNRLRP